jgi:Rap1a immunity proteins
MGKRMLFATILTSLLATPVVADTGNDLKTNCDVSAERNPENYMYCLGYISGVMEQWGIDRVVERSIASSPQRQQWMEDLHYPPFCPPPESTKEQFRAIVVKFLNSQPEYLHQEASIFVVNALKNAFPCEK